jgi:hypothetical protein
MVTLKEVKNIFANGCKVMCASKEIYFGIVKHNEIKYIQQEEMICYYFNNLNGFDLILYHSSFGFAEIIKNTKKNYKYIYR